VLSTFWHGLRIDISASAYLSVIPLLLWLGYQFVAHKWLDYLLTFYNTITIIIVVAICLIDAQLYSFWGQKLNAYASSFAKFPKDMFSFSSGILVGKLFFFLLFTSFLVKMFYDNVPIKFNTTQQRLKVGILIPTFIIMSGIMLLLIRGNIGMSPINQSFAYFSNKPYLNHAAVNTVWNFVASISEQSKIETVNPYTSLNEHEAQMLVDSLMEKSNKLQHHNMQLFTQNKPDVLLLILEGWSADVVEFTGGERDVTPHFNQWAKQSLVYTNFYANGNRTDKGLASIISGQPAFANSSIINRIEKFTQLPALPKSLNPLGYKSTFIYGGEAEFANMKAYWLNSGYTGVVDIHQFNKAVLPENWGVHDAELYQKIASEMETLPSPKFVTALTLSSHEPYKVPHQSKFTGNTQADMYRNAVHYADECLHQFLTQAQKHPWYKNTLILIMSDHGHQEPLNRSPFESGKFHIPLLITGGALQPDLMGKQVYCYSQQTDFASGLLHQFGVGAHEYKWSNNLFDTLRNGYATYTFSDGIGIINKQDYLVFDQESKNNIVCQTRDSVRLQKTIRAYQQLFYEEYLHR
jgi:phosphoglycerol transferase MdoB-like AlkP superfamily enzyme